MLPLAAPGIIAGCILVGIPATGEYVIPAILGGDKTLMLGNVIADQFLKVGDYPFGSALAMALMTILTVILSSPGAACAATRRSRSVRRPSGLALVSLGVLALLCTRRSSSWSSTP